MKIKERKHHIDGRVEEFNCDVVEISSDHAIVDFIWHRDEPLDDGPFQLPAGAIHTRAYFWANRNYLVYAISLDGNEILGHRFDVCEDIRISTEQIEFLDLALDLWIDSDGKIHVLDQDEVDQYRASGLISIEQYECILSTRNFLLSNHDEVIDNLKR